MKKAIIRGTEKAGGNASVFVRKNGSVKVIFEFATLRFSAEKDFLAWAMRSLFVEKIIWA